MDNPTGSLFLTSRCSTAGRSSFRSRRGSCLLLIGRGIYIWVDRRTLAGSRLRIWAGSSRRTISSKLLLLGPLPLLELERSLATLLHPLPFLVGNHMLLVLVYLVIRGLLVQKFLPFRLHGRSETFGEFLQMNDVVGPNTQVPRLELGHIKLVIKVGQEAINLVSSQLGQSLVGIGLDVFGPDKVGFDRGAQEFAQIGLLQTLILPGGDAELGQFDLNAVHREGTVVLAWTEEQLEESVQGGSVGGGHGSRINNIRDAERSGGPQHARRVERYCSLPLASYDRRGSYLWGLEKTSTSCAFSGIL